GHDFAERPLTSTVQAPQKLVSQPMCVPARSSSSRRNSTSSMRDSTSARTGLPFTLHAMATLDALSGIVVLHLHTLAGGAARRYADRFPQQPAHQGTLVSGRAALVRLRSGRSHAGLGGGRSIFLIN